MSAMQKTPGLYGGDVRELSIDVFERPAPPKEFADTYILIAGTVLVAAIGAFVTVLARETSLTT